MQLKTDAFTPLLTFRIWILIIFSCFMFGSNSKSLAKDLPLEPDKNMLGFLKAKLGPSTRIQVIHTVTAEGQLELARRFIDSSIKEYPKNFDIRLLSYQDYMSQKKYSEALSDANILVELKPNSWYAYSYLAQAQAKLDQHTPAIDNYDKAIALNSHVPFLYKERGISYLANDIFYNALKDLQQATLLYLEEGETVEAQNTFNIYKLAQIQELKETKGPGALVP